MDAMQALKELVGSLKGADVDFNNQFAVGLQYKGAARRGMVKKLTKRHVEALMAAQKLVQQDAEENRPAFWVFNWKGGGYNIVHGGAKSHAEALRKAREFAAECKLILDEPTLRQISAKEMDRIDAQYRGMFD